MLCVIYFLIFECR